MESEAKSDLELAYELKGVRVRQWRQHDKKLEMQASSQAWLEAWPRGKAVAMQVEAQMQVCGQPWADDA